jgi:hypothetical protein
VVRHRFFATRRRFADLEELNDWSAGECRNRTATAKHLELKDRTIDQVFADTTAPLDRVTHHCEIVETGNKIWRIRPRINK